MQDILKFLESTYSINKKHERGIVKMLNKKVMLCMLIVFSLVGCSGREQEKYSESYEQTQDSQNFSATREVTATKNGFYVILEDFIWFVDKKSEKTIPLCGKPNCTHMEHSCNAYFSVPLSIQAYDGSIYVVARGTKSGTESLYRISEDGSKREELKTLYTCEEGDMSCCLDFVIHRGYGYMVTNWVQKDRIEKTQTLYRIALDSTNEKEEVAKVRGYTPMIYIIGGYGNSIYFSTNCYTDEDGRNLEILNYEYDIVEKKVEKKELPNKVSLIGEKDNRYYCYKKDGKGIISYDKQGKNPKEIFNWKYDNTLIYHDNQYLYIDNEVYLLMHNQPDIERKVIIIDYDGNIICEWKRDRADKNKICWSDSEHLLLKKEEKNNFQILKLTDVSSLKQKGRIWEN